MTFNRTKRCDVAFSDTQFIGTMKSQNGYVHRRSINVRANGYDIRDSLTASRNNEFELILHTPCEARCENGIIKLFYRDRHMLTIECEMDFEIKHGIRSLYYLTEEKISLICFKGTLKNYSMETLIKLDIMP